MAESALAITILGGVPIRVNIPPIEAAKAIGSNSFEGLVPIRQAAITAAGISTASCRCCS